ncbi:interaptin-like isoform X2 [Crassostrea angulata]|uniref:interaptin-like isoform X2 n=1 Tax=Magallana angulata TaxID=2784310 RepID=UPI0022B14FB2|nr:interaptin-like isoform X2 [Crassostrea angulata]
MATAVHSGVAEQPFYNTGDEETTDDAIRYIWNRTGNPPVNANHVYRLKKHMDKFLHPNPTLRDNTGGTIPTPSPCEPIAESLLGWEDVSPQDNVEAVFHFIPEDDQKFAYDQFFRKLGRAPRVLEFSRFLLIFQGQLFLENEEFRETLDRHLKTIELQEQMLSSKDTMIQVLGQCNNENKKEVDNLQSQKRNLESIITNVQHQKADLQLEFNSMKRKFDQHLAELEDERTDKQQLQADKQALIHTITAHEHNIDRLTGTVKDLGQRLHRESKDKSAILKELSEKLKLVSELEEDKEILMMENEAQGRYFLELKEEKIKLQKENEELKEAIEISKIILAEQYEKLMIKVAELESENSNLQSKTEEQSATISDLESKTGQQSVTISDLESKTEQQSVTISDLESKNSDLESKNSDLESKNSDLENKTEQQSVTISDLESKNTDLESKTEQQSTTITAIQQQYQRQQYFILFLAALIFAMVCLQFLSQGNNLPSRS